MPPQQGWEVSQLQFLSPNAANDESRNLLLYEQTPTTPPNALGRLASLKLRRSGSGWSTPGQSFSENLIDYIVILYCMVMSFARLLLADDDFLIVIVSTCGRMSFSKRGWFWKVMSHSSPDSGDTRIATLAIYEGRLSGVSWHLKRLFPYNTKSLFCLI